MKQKTFMKKYAPVLLLAVIVVLFSVLTGGQLLSAQGISDLFAKNAYIAVFACGILLCILAGRRAKFPVWGTILCALAGIFLWHVLEWAVLRSGADADGGFLGLFTGYVSIPVLDGGSGSVSHPSALIIGILAAVLLVVYKFYSLGKQKRSRSMKGNPREQLAEVLILDVVIIFCAARLSQYEGIPVALVLAAAIILCFSIVGGRLTDSDGIRNVMAVAVLLAVINQGMVLCGLPDISRYVVRDAVLLAAVIFDVVSNKKTGKS